MDSATYYAWLAETDWAQLYGSLAVFIVVVGTLITGVAAALRFWRL